MLFKKLMLIPMFVLSLGLQTYTVSATEPENPSEQEQTDKERAAMEKAVSLEQKQRKLLDPAHDKALEACELRLTTLLAEMKFDGMFAQAQKKYIQWLSTRNEESLAIQGMSQAFISVAQYGMLQGIHRLVIMARATGTPLNEQINILFVRAQAQENPDEVSVLRGSGVKLVQ
jgi:transcriptional regulator GlxA family with amidase domain